MPFFNQGSHALPSLLSILNNNKVRGITRSAEYNLFKNLQFGSIQPDSVVNASAINLIYNLLSNEDYFSVAEQLSQDSDAKNLLDFMLRLLRDGLPPNMDGIKWRARRLMFKIISRIPVIPPSLIVTGVSMPERRDSIGSGGFGRVFKAELQGAVVALKLLHKTDNNVVSPSCYCHDVIALISFQ